MKTRRCLAALLIVLGMDAWIWTNDSRRHVPLIGMCCSFLSHGTPTVSLRFPHILLVRVDGELRLLDPINEQHPAILNPRPAVEHIAQLWLVGQRETIGLLAPVVATYGHTMGVASLQRAPTATELIEARRLLSTFIVQTYGPSRARQAALLAAGDGATREILWGGLIHDALALPLIVAFFWSLYLNTLYNAAAARKQRRSRELLDSGLCPRCRYDIVSVLRSGTTTCPECGQSLHLDTPDRGELHKD